MRLIFCLGIIFLMSCTSMVKKTEYAHEVYVTYNDGKSDTITFNSFIIADNSLTQYGCTIYLTNNCLHILGCDECDLTGITRCDVRKYDHKIVGSKESVVKQ